MKKTHRNFYFLFIPFIVCVALNTLWKNEEYINSFTLLFFEVGVFSLIAAVLTKMGYIANPYDMVSKDETIQRNYSFYNYLFLGVLGLLCGIIGYTGNGLLAIFVMFICMIISFVCAGYAKKLYKDK